MAIVRLNELPEGSGNLTSDDIFVFMDNPSSSGITKKISLSELSNAINPGNPFDQDLNTFNEPIFSQLTIAQTQHYVMGNTDGNIVTSNDGLNWYGPFDLDTDISHIATNGNLIVTIDESNISYTSFTNPSTATPISISLEGISNLTLNQIIYGGDYFVVCGHGYDGVKNIPTYGYSVDGINWTFKIVEGDLATTLANNNNENCTFSDIDYNDHGWNFAVSSNNVGGGVYTTNITETFTNTNYFGMVAGYQVAWNGNAWYYINSDAGSGFNTSVDPRSGEWVGPYNPWSSSQQDLGINLSSQISDTFCGGNGILAFSDYTGHVSFSSDNGANWTYITPIPYTVTITNISYVDNKYQLTLSGTFTSHDIGEKITISGSSVSEYNGTFFLDSNNFLYTDYQLTTPWVSEVLPFSGTANLTWSHGTYIDAMDYVNGYFYIGNDDEQIARSSNLINWSIVDDQNNAFAYWNDFSGYISSGIGSGLVLTSNTITLPNGTSLAQGTFDNSTGGNGGISLNCSIGYELNWQGGHLKSTADNGVTSSNIYVDSALEFPGENSDNMQIDSAGLTFPDGTTQTTAASNNPTVVQLGNVSGLISTDSNAGDIFDLTLVASGTLSNPLNPTDGETLRWRIKYNANSLPFNLDNKFQIPSSATSPLPFSASSGVKDLLAATYDQSEDKWDIIAFIPGY